MKISTSLHFTAIISHQEYITVQASLWYCIQQEFYLKTCYKHVWRLKVHSV